MQLNQLEMLSYVTIMHQLISNYSVLAQIYVVKCTIQHYLAHVQDLITTLLGVRYINDK